MNPLWKSRLTMMGVAALFFASFGVALYLIRSGWQPTAMRNAGELLDPPRLIDELGLATVDGKDYAWQPERRLWRLVVVPPRECDVATCAAFVDTLYRIWMSEGRHADRVHVLWFGEVPQGAPAFRAFLPMRANPALRATLPGLASDGDLSVYLIDPSGYLVMRHPAGFDPTGLRKDLARLLKVTEP